MGKLIKFAKKSALPLAILSILILLGLSLPVGGRRSLSVQSASMEPAIKTGSLVFVSNVSAADVQSGDIITYINPRNTAESITHRVKQVSQNSSGQTQFITQGDANPVPDRPITEKYLIGKVGTTIPYLGYGTSFIKSPLGLLLIIYLPALVIVINEIKRLAAYYRSLRFTIPGFMNRDKKSPGLTSYGLAIVFAAGIISLGTTLQAHAAFFSSAALTGNTFTVKSEDPEPPIPPDGGTDKISLRRVFIVCNAEQETATTVHVMLYNSSRQNVDISGWSIKSGDETFLTFPNNTTITARSTYDTEAPIVDGISYPEGELKLFDQSVILKDETSWSPNTRGNRECRLNQ